MKCFCCCSDGPHRFVTGTLCFLFGSISLLIAQQVYEPTYEIENDDENETAVHGEATATTAVILCALVLCFALLTLIVHIICIRRVKQQQAQAKQGMKSSTASTTRHHGYVFQQLTWNSRSRVLLLAPAVSLFLVLVIRLFVGANVFEGIPYYLDYGWKYGLLPHDRSVEEDGDELYNEPAEKSVAFIVEFNSYGHAMQGFFSALIAFPVVSNVLAGGCLKSSVIWRSLVHLTPYALTIYPAYSLIKRFNKAADAFAGSSFSNNAFEWAAGFMVACAFGNLLTSIAILVRISKQQYEQGNDEESASHVEYQHWQTDNDKVPTPTSNTNKTRTENKQEEVGTFIKILQILLGVLFVFTVFAASVLFGLTWHGCLDGSPDECVNYSVDGPHASSGLFAVFCLIPGIALVGSLMMECWRKQRENE